MKRHHFFALLLVVGLVAGCHSPVGQSFDRALFTPTAWQTNTANGATSIVAVAWEPNAATVNTIQAVGSLVPGYGSLAGLLATSALGLVAHIRSRRYKAAAVSVIEGVNETMKQLPPEQHDTLRAVHKTAQVNAGTRETVRTLLKTL